MANTAIHYKVLQLLEKPLGRTWTIQGFGMLRTYLDPDQVNRLHIWDPDTAVPDVSTVHDHPWDFVSNIVSGTLLNQRYSVSSGDDHGAEPFQHSLIACGMGGGLVGEADTVWLHDELPEELGAGDRYEQRANELHESQPAAGAVTIISRVFGANRDSANVYWSDGEWVSAEPRVATDAEVLHFTRLALEHWTP